MKPIAPNTLLQNRYLIVHLIGKGGMGEVYLAVDQRLGSAIALKRTFYADDEMLGSAFEREARTLARLRHNVLPKVSDHFTEEGNQYLIMEHISGEDLSKRLENSNKPFPLSWVLFWADQLLDALNYLHSNEPPIIHRDIKPQNLKLTDENSIVLLDFGLSKNSIDVKGSVPSTGSVVGYTPHFAPMEQIRGTGTDARSDLYSLSATLYQLLTNTVPPDALTRADALLSGMSDPLQPLNEVNAQVTPLIAQIIAHGMEVSQEKRFATAREMQKALRDAYAQMQNSSPAQKEVVKSNTLKTPEIAQSQLVTELISNPKNQAATNNQSLSAAANPTAKPQVNGNYSSDQPKPEMPDFDATLAYDPKAEIYGVKTSDVKTEVLLAGSTPEIVAAQQEYQQSNQSSSVQNDFAANESFEAEEKSAGVESFSPDATIPLISYDAGRDNVGSQPAPEVSQPASVAATDASSPAFMPTTQYSREDFQIENYNDAPDRDEPTKTAAAAVVGQDSVIQRKSGGKGIYIFGGVGALLIIFGALAVGFYMVSSSNNTITKPVPTPKVEETVETAATPLPTVEPTTTPETNSNSAVAENPTVNANTEVLEKPAPGKPSDSQFTGKTSPPPPPTAPVKPTPRTTTPSTTTAPKPVVKPTAPAKPTPLPRILP